MPSALKKSSHNFYPKILLTNYPSIPCLQPNLWIPFFLNFNHPFYLWGRIYGPVRKEILSEIIDEIIKNNLKLVLKPTVLSVFLRIKLNYHKSLDCAFSIFTKWEISGQNRKQYGQISEAIRKFDEANGKFSKPWCNCKIFHVTFIKLQLPGGFEKKLKQICQLTNRVQIGCKWEI